MDTFFKLAVTLIGSGLLLMMVAAFIETFFRNSALADRFGYTGLALIVFTVVIGIVAGIVAVWQN